MLKEDFPSKKEESSSSTQDWPFNIIVHFPPGTYARLINDGKKLKDDRGKLKYDERETGSFVRMMKTLELITQEENIHIEPSASFLCELHKCAFTNVFLHAYRQSSNDIASPGKFRTNYVHVPIKSYTTSRKGLTEFLRNIAKGKIEGAMIIIPSSSPFKNPQATWLDYINFYQERIDKKIKITRDNYLTVAEQIWHSLENSSSQEEYGYVYTTCEPSKISNKIGDGVNKVMQQYATTMELYRKGCSDLEWLVSKIVESSQQLVRIHPFVDANTRVIISCWMNFCFMRMGLPYAALYDPNRFDFYSVPELTNEVLNGMQLTLSYFLEPNKSYLNFNPYEDLEFSTWKEEEEKILYASHNKLTSNQLDNLKKQAKNASHQVEFLKYNKSFRNSFFTTFDLKNTQTVCKEWYSIINCVNKL